MDVQSKARERMGDLFESLGKNMREYLDDLSTDTAGDRAAMEKSIRGVISALDEVVVTARKAVVDPALRRDVTQLVVSVREVLVATLTSPLRRTNVITQRVRSRTRSLRAPAVNAPKTKLQTTTPRKAPTAARKPATTVGASKANAHKG